MTICITYCAAISGSVIINIRLVETVAQLVIWCKPTHSRLLIMDQLLTAAYVGVHDYVECAVTEEKGGRVADYQTVRRHIYKWYCNVWNIIFVTVLHKRFNINKSA